MLNLPTSEKFGTSPKDSCVGTRENRTLTLQMTLATCIHTGFRDTQTDNGETQELGKKAPPHRVSAKHVEFGHTKPSNKSRTSQRCQRTLVYPAKRGWEFTSFAGQHRVVVFERRLRGVNRWIGLLVIVLFAAATRRLQPQETRPHAADPDSGGALARRGT